MSHILTWLLNQEWLLSKQLTLQFKKKENGLVALAFTGHISDWEVAHQVDQWNGLARMLCDALWERGPCNNKVNEPNYSGEIGLLLLGTGSRAGSKANVAKS